MHGRILWQFREYVEAKHGPDTWGNLLQSAGLQDRVYFSQAYPDAEIFSLVAAAAKLSGKSVRCVLEEFGEFTVPALLQMYAHLIEPKWRSLDVLEHAELAHIAARRERTGAAPPYLRTHRVTPRTLVMTYNSSRKLCGFAVGVGCGLGKHFKEGISIRHGVCMLHGADHCEITYMVI